MEKGVSDSVGKVGALYLMTTEMGISLLIIPLKSLGVSRRRMENTGVNASGSTFIEFDDVRVPVENLIGAENRGFEIIMSSLCSIFRAYHCNEQITECTQISTRNVSPSQQRPSASPALVPKTPTATPQPARPSAKPSLRTKPSAPKSANLVN